MHLNRCARGEGEEAVCSAVEHGWEIPMVSTKVLNFVTDLGLVKWHNFGPGYQG
jgi:hypothetical protein